MTCRFGSGAFSRAFFSWVPPAPHARPPDDFLCPARAASGRRARWTRATAAGPAPSTPCRHAPAPPAPVLCRSGGGVRRAGWRFAGLESGRRGLKVGRRGVQGRRGAMEDTWATLPADGRPSPRVLQGRWRLFGVFDGRAPRPAAARVALHDRPQPPHVQLVRRDGRDVSTLYGREGGREGGGAICFT